MKESESDRAEEDFRQAAQADAVAVSIDRDVFRALVKRARDNNSTPRRELHVILRKHL